MTRTTASVIPAIGFGSSGLGNMPDTYGYSVSEEQAHETINTIFDSEYAFIDTSRAYGFGRSEQRIGDVIRSRGGLPEGAVLSSKLDRDLDTGRFDAAQARRSLEQSLEALGIDCIPMLHLHDPEHARSLDEIGGSDGAIAELFRMKEEGLTKWVGLAAGRVDIMMPLLQAWEFDVLITHNRFTLTNRNAEPMMDLAVSRNIAVLNAAPYAGGALAKGSREHPRYVYQEASDDVLAPVRRVEEICAQHGVPTGAAALQFSLRDDRVASTICGVTRPARVAQTLEWVQWPIPEQLWADLGQLSFATDDPEATRKDYKPG